VFTLIWARMVDLGVKLRRRPSSPRFVAKLKKPDWLFSASLEREARSAIQKNGLVLINQIDLGSLPNCQRTVPGKLEARLVAAKAVAFTARYLNCFVPTPSQLPILSERSPGATGLASSLSGCFSFSGQRCVFHIADVLEGFHGSCL
jgi:hypothetical protein